MNSRRFEIYHSVVLKRFRTRSDFTKFHLKTSWLDDLKISLSVRKFKGTQSGLSSHSDALSDCPQQWFSRWLTSVLETSMMQLDQRWFWSLAKVLELKTIPLKKWFYTEWNLLIIGMAEQRDHVFEIHISHFERTFRVLLNEHPVFTWGHFCG